MSSQKPAPSMSGPPRVVPSELPVLFVSEFVAYAHDQQVLVDFSAGITMQDRVPTLPIHTRLAMPWSAAQKLIAVLTQAVQHHDRTAALAAPARTTLPPLEMPDQAHLPKLTV